MVRAMKEAFGSKPEELYTAIGPSICQDCYEVSEDVAEVFRKEFPFHREERKLLYRKENGKYQLNLWRANEIIFQEAEFRRSGSAFLGSVPAVIRTFCFHTEPAREKGEICRLSWNPGVNGIVA